MPSGPRGDRVTEVEGGLNFLPDPGWAWHVLSALRAGSFDSLNFNGLLTAIISSIITVAIIFIVINVATEACF